MERPDVLPPDALGALLDELCRAMDQAHCAEAQADGAPCTSAGTDCPCCRRFQEALARLRAGARD